MPGRRFTPEELARSAAAGEPRLDTDFHDAGAWRAYQDQWFASHHVDWGRGAAACR